MLLISKTLISSPLRLIRQSKRMPSLSPLLNITPFMRQIHNTPLISFGITDTISDMFRSKLTEKKEKTFHSMIELMIDTPQWKMKIWKVTVEEQVNQWQMKIPGISSMDEAKVGRQLVKIMNVMTDEELEHPERIKGPQREKIALKASVTADDVSYLISVYQQSLVTYEWLKYKRANGEALPTTEQELREMQMNDSRMRNIANKVLLQEGGKRRTGRKRSLF